MKFCQPLQLEEDCHAKDNSEVLAVYDGDASTIYLSEEWTGKTPAELSILVHEIVHHLQSGNKLKFAFLEERETMAYEAQERWLKLFGSTLEEEFALDPFTVLVRTNCLF